MNREEIAIHNSKVWFENTEFDESNKDAELEIIVRNFLCGEVLAEETLTNKQKAIVILVSLVTCQTLSSISTYTIAALNVGVTAEEIKESIYQCTPYIGIEKVKGALIEVNKAFDKAGVKYPLKKQATVNEDTRFDKGLELQRTIFGSYNINSMREEAPMELKGMQDYLSAYCFGDFYTRNNLDLKTRELIVFCAISSLGGCEPQLKAHVKANFSVGNTKEVLIAALIQCLPFIGFPRILNAINCIDNVTKS